MELAAARQEGFVGKYSSETNGNHTRKRLLAVIGVVTGFGRKSNRDAIRKSWLPTGRVFLHLLLFEFSLFVLDFIIILKRNALIDANFGLKTWFASEQENSVILDHQFFSPTTWDEPFDEFYVSFWNDS